MSIRCLAVLVLDLSVLGVNVCLSVHGLSDIRGRLARERDVVEC